MTTQEYKCCISELEQIATRLAAHNRTQSDRTYSSNIRIVLWLIYQATQLLTEDQLLYQATELLTEDQPLEPIPF